MGGAAPRRRVMIAVSPPLLADLIARQLDAGIDVVVEPATDERSAASAGAFDVVVTNEPSLPLNADAVVVITPLDSPNIECWLRTRTRELPIPVRDMDDIVALVDALA
jgi:hypothetical protein